MRLNLWQILMAAMLALVSAQTFAAPAECIVPAKPGGGLDLVCKLIRDGLQANGQTAARDDLPRISYLPGGVGAVAWNSIVTRRRAEPDTLVAFSGGSLLNLAIGKFGNASIDDVRWVAGVGADYGMIAVRNDSPYKTLRDLVDALKHNPEKVTIGASGTIGSQDWLKMTLIVKQEGIDAKRLRFVALEGGGESFTALMGGYVQAVSGDASEAAQHAVAGKIRVLAVLSDARLSGVLADVPTAREQGFDVTWPIIRGVYVGPNVSNADYRKWVATFDHMMAQPSFAQLRAARGLHPFALTGDQLTAYIKKTVANYGKQGKELGLIR
jgi:putative tricarboxylic transport membrane protein